MTAGGPIRAAAGAVLLDLRVIPRSPRTAIDGIRDGRLVLRVTAPPVDHAANEAVVAALGDLLRVPKRAIAVAAGATSRNKTMKIEGIGSDEVAARLDIR